MRWPAFGSKFPAKKSSHEEAGLLRINVSRAVIFMLVEAALLQAPQLAASWSYRIIFQITVLLKSYEYFCKATILTAA